MSINIQIWVEISHQASFRAGGWAYVLSEGSSRLGAAGGDRSVTAERIALSALIAALTATPAGAIVEVRSASPAVLAAVKRLAPGAEPPEEDLEFWAPLSAALAARKVRFAATANAPRSPSAFALAWAELARDKGKTAPFKAVIPKANLAKAGAPG
jgi:ribonuclease HI